MIIQHTIQVQHKRSVSSCLSPTKFQATEQFSEIIFLVMDIINLVALSTYTNNDTINILI